MASDPGACYPEFESLMWIRPILYLYIQGRLVNLNQEEKGMSEIVGTGIGMMDLSSFHYFQVQSKFKSLLSVTNLFIFYPTNTFHYKATIEGFCLLLNFEYGLAVHKLLNASDSSPKI